MRARNHKNSNETFDCERRLVCPPIFHNVQQFLARLYFTAAGLGSYYTLVRYVLERTGTASLLGPGQVVLNRIANSVQQFQVL